MDMSIFCWIGLHRWDFRDRHKDGWVTTEARCRRGCRRYPTWAMVNRERAPRDDVERNQRTGTGG